MSQMSSPFVRKIDKAIRNPILALDLLGARFRQSFGDKEFVAETRNRSESERTGLYVAFVQRAVRSPRVFENFKRHPNYQSILENVSQGDGERYLERIQAESPQLLQRIEEFKENDLIGNPVTYSYPEVGRISPTTLRYIKVSSDLLKYFGTNIGRKIVEVGVGYGGQLLVNDLIFDLDEYHLYDLPPVLDLVSKYLESFILNCSYNATTLNQSTKDDSFDLVISNYAFAELPSQLQRAYIRKILSKSNKGYLTMNSGKDNSQFTKNHLSLNDLRELLPRFEIIDENPLTCPNNYIIIWGHRAS